MKLKLLTIRSTRPINCDAVYWSKKVRERKEKEKKEKGTDLF